MCRSTDEDHLATHQPGSLKVAFISSLVPKNLKTEQLRLEITESLFQSFFLFYVKLALKNCPGTRRSDSLICRAVDEGTIKTSTHTSLLFYWCFCSGALAIL
jgi:hypothetical protein